MSSLAKTLDELERLVRANHLDDIAADPKRFREALLRGLRRRFRLPTGRRKEEHLNEAERLRRLGHTWNAVAALLNPEYGLLDEFRRLKYRRSLESGIRRRKRNVQIVAKSITPAIDSAVIEVSAAPKLDVERSPDNGSTHQQSPTGA